MAGVTYLAPDPLGPPDCYGIPARFFGRVDEEFFGLIGRVTMVAAALENRLTILVTELTGSSQGKRAGKMAGALIPEIEQALENRPAEFKAEGNVLIERLRRAFEGRNEVVHSLWPNPHLARAWGHRLVRPRNQTTPGDPSAAVETNEESLIALIKTLVSLHIDVERFGQKAQMPENGRA